MTPAQEQVIARLETDDRALLADVLACGGQYTSPAHRKVRLCLLLKSRSFYVVYDSGTITRMRRDGVGRRDIRIDWR